MKKFLVDEPVMLALSGKENIVSNNAAKDVRACLDPSKSGIVEWPKADHVPMYDKTFYKEIVGQANTWFQKFAKL